jgi:hypothetical protein
MGANKKNKYRSNNYVGFERPMLLSPEWLSLSKKSMLAYLYFKCSFVGGNNGQITLPYSELKKILKSSETVSKAIKELQEKGWIEVTAKGGMFHNASKYRLTFAFDRFARPKGYG